MKILIVLLRMSGGVGRANTEIAKALKTMGHEVEFLSREDDLHLFSLAKSIFPLRNKIRALVKEKKFDVIYTQDYSCALPLLLPYPLFWKKHFSCFCGVKSGKHPTLFQKHHRLVQRSVGTIMGKKLVVIGDQLKAIFPKSTLIYRGVNLKTFTPLGKKRNAIGWIEKDVELISKKELEKIAQQTKLRLAIAKNISPENMNAFYNQCKVFIDLPRTAGFNLAWLEAMAAGVPLIIGNEKGAGTILPLEKVSDDTNHLEQITRIIKSKKKVHYRKWLIQHAFSWEKKAQELVSFLKKKLHHEKTHT